jgi:hypothetical protein
MTHQPRGLLFAQTVSCAPAEGNAVSKPGEDEEDGRLDVTAVDKRLESLKRHLGLHVIYGKAALGP